MNRRGLESGATISEDALFLGFLVGEQHIDFSAKRGFMVRSEGGEDVINFNSLPGRTKGNVHFPPIGAFQASPAPEQN